MTSHCMIRFKAQALSCQHKKFETVLVFEFDFLMLVSLFFGFCAICYTKIIVAAYPLGKLAETDPYGYRHNGSNLYGLNIIISIPQGPSFFTDTSFPIAI